jgi:hypothetical protein
MSFFSSFPSIKQSPNHFKSIPFKETHPRTILIPRLNTASPLHALPSRLKHSRDAGVLETAAGTDHIRDSRGRFEDERHATAVEAAEEILVLRTRDAADVG